VIPLRDNVRSRSWPVVNVLLILASAAAFVYELSLQRAGLLEGFIQNWAVVPERLARHPFADGATVVSAMFLHGGWSHIIGNMMYLWIFGDNVEDRLGHFRYLVFYLLAGTAATAAQVFLNPASALPNLGASGAIAGVLGAYFVLYPRARVETLIPLGFFSRIVEVPAFFFLGFWFLIQALQGWGSLAVGPVRGDVGGVAWWAHLGGFAAGFILVWFFKKR
jgi:membrane associated rhomboid family serine protease